MNGLGRLAGACGVALASAPGVLARACSVCAGNPDSELARGAQAGVLVLMGFIACVLAGIVSVSSYWIVRAHRLGRQPAPPDEPLGGVP